MVMTTAANSGAPILRPEEVHELLVRPAFELSVAAQVLNLVEISGNSIRFPVVTADPQASWVNEGAEIPITDQGFAEVDVVPSKLAGLTVVTRELADDSSPEASQAVGEGIARDIARKIDAALFGPTAAAPAPSGLAGLTGITAVPAPAGFGGNLDVFAAAASGAEQEGAVITAWVTNPATALTLAGIKTATGSNQNLLAVDPAQPSRRLVEGRPLLVSPAVPARVVYGIPGDRAHLVVRDDATVDVDRSVFFTSDRVAVR